MDKANQGSKLVAQAAAGTSQPATWQERTVDYRRHIEDLRSRSYEGAKSREEREETFYRAFELVAPVAEQVLTELNCWFLRGSGEVTTERPVRDASGGLDGFWSVSWPLQRQSINRFTQEPLEPVAIHAIFPRRPSLGMEWTHPHLALLRPGCKEGIAAAWPLQVTSSEDAVRQAPILRVLAEAELHERTFLADLNWRLLASLYESV
jgi:hypothetical protein